VDAAEPPRIVFESGTACADRDGAESALRRALEVARAPRPGWVITTRIETATAPAPGLTAEAEITDDAGATFAHNVLSGETDCATLARSAGEWAKAALQTQLPVESPAPVPEKAQPPEEAPQSLPAPVPPAAPPATASSPRPSFRSPRLLDAEEPPETDEGSAKLEIGAGTFLLAGASPGGFVGVTPFLIVKMGDDVFLRPSLAIGKPLSSSANATWGAARLDTCARLSGLYARGQGMELDACGGADAGFSHIGSGTQVGAPATSITQPYIDLGPSFDLRAEAGRLVISLRALAGFNVARQQFTDATATPVDAGPLSLRVEMDFSWRLPNARAGMAAVNTAAAGL
jgi:hypothetical protein